MGKVTDPHRKKESGVIFAQKIYHKFIPLDQTIKPTSLPPKAFAQPATQLKPNRLGLLGVI